MAETNTKNGDKQPLKWQWSFKWIYVLCKLEKMWHIINICYEQGNFRWIHILFRVVEISMTARNIIHVFGEYINHLRTIDIKCVMKKAKRSKREENISTLVDMVDVWNITRAQKFPDWKIAFRLSHGSIRFAVKIGTPKVSITFPSNKICWLSVCVCEGERERRGCITARASKLSIRKVYGKLCRIIH